MVAKALTYLFKGETTLPAAYTYDGQIAESKYIDPADRHGYTFLECLACREPESTRRRFGETSKARDTRVRQWKTLHRRDHA